MTDRLVVLIEGKRTDRLSAATDWYPARDQLVRNLEAARQVAHGRAFATLLITEHPYADGTHRALAASLEEAAPHLDDAERAELQRSYLGQMTWEDACAAVGVDWASLPETTAQLQRPSTPRSGV